ncbi:uncharacterized protein LOC113747643 [Larimichthys crocea]|uniref:uncharacterized protein LOC113747643 n=1 Tax=Larimichthys crocea TaxID=215358 RepID=UPI000F5EFA08|nr:uncharacterized protein LOC113747643 [Larimichthys crocea]
MASYCESHLETAAALSKHTLIEPVSNPEDRRCKKHEKILELFCKEGKFICQICAEACAQQKMEHAGVHVCHGSRQEDPQRAQEEFKQAYALPSTQTWPSVPMNEVDFLGYIQTSLISAREFIDLEIRAQSAAGLKKVQTFAADVTTDPNTAGPWLIISEDGKEVHGKHFCRCYTGSNHRQALVGGRGEREIQLGAGSRFWKSEEQIAPAPEKRLVESNHFNAVSSFAEGGGVCGLRGERGVVHRRGGPDSHLHLHKVQLQRQDLPHL